ncbi:type II toxin-antitoxin system VapC family toxin [Archaeoglobus sp.]
MRVYLDTCVWCRLFDEPNERIEKEARAVITILKKARKDKIEIFGSTTVLAEIDLIPSEEKRNAVRSLVEKSCRIIWIKDADLKLAEKIKMLCQIDVVDALHIAVASKFADVFLTVDDELLKKSSCLKKYIEVRNLIDIV